MKSTLTIHQIAEELQLSASTISFVLNGQAGKYRISNSVQERVLLYLQKNEYVPDKRAKSLRTKKNQIICLIVNDITEPVYAKLTFEVEKMAFKNNYKLILHNINNNRKKAHEVILNCRDKQADGCIIGLTDKIIHRDILYLIDNNFPLVLFKVEGDKSWIHGNTVCDLPLVNDQIHTIKENDKNYPRMLFNTLMNKITSA